MVGCRVRPTKAHKDWLREAAQRCVAGETAIAFTCSSGHAAPSRCARIPSPRTGSVRSLASPDGSDRKIADRQVIDGRGEKPGLSLEEVFGNSPAVGWSCIGSCSAISVVLPSVRWDLRAQPKCAPMRECGCVLRLGKEGGAGGQPGRRSLAPLRGLPRCRRDWPLPSRQRAPQIPLPA